MLNQSVRVNMNAPATGIIQRSSDKSFFIRCHQRSNLSDSIFDSNPTYEGKRICVLQAMLINDGYILIEVEFL